jgi:hypothetical protein
MAGPAAEDVLPLVLAAAIPLLFLHVRYQLHVSVGPVDVYGSDLAVAATVAAAVVSGLHLGWSPLARGRPLWTTAALLLGLFVLSCFWRPLELPFKHLVTAAKAIEYALLAPALVLLLRRRVDVERFLAAFVVWACAAAGWGVLMFLGVVNDPDGPRPGQREVSFLGHQDLGAFTGAALAIGFASIMLGVHRRLGLAATVAGALGVILDASFFVYVGVFAAAGATVFVAARRHVIRPSRLAALAAVMLIAGSGVFLLRGSDVSNYLAFVGVARASRSIETHIETGAQRTMLAWIGLRMWREHPILGLGFERSNYDFEPYLGAARRRFPNEPPAAFPSPAHRWGVQNFWIELMADTGLVGLALGVAVFAAGVIGGVRAAADGHGFAPLVGAGFVLVAAGTWNALGIVSGLPLDAVTWLGLGLTVAGAQLA